MAFQGKKDTTNNSLFGGGTGPKAWTSQENKFCTYCKCWVGDNPVSKNFHEQGKRHKEAFENHMNEMKKKAYKDNKKEKFEANTLRAMEEAALESYREKDVLGNRDFTAKLYNEQQEGLAASSGPSANPFAEGPAKPAEKEQKQNKVDPMAAVTGDAPDRWDKDYLAKMEAVKKAVSDTGVKSEHLKPGGKWSAEATEGQPKLWYEAKDDDDNSYYYHIKTSESRWDAPPWGFMSIEEQKEVSDVQLRKSYNKEAIISEQRAVHGERRKKEIIHESMPDMSAKDPYGKGGFAEVQEEEAEQVMDLGLPAKRTKMVPVIDAEEERLVITERTVEPGKLSSAANRYGLVPLPDQVEKVEKLVQVTAPKISFRKRKNQSLRERGDDD